VPPRTLTGYLEKICAQEGVQVERGVLPLVVRAGAGSVRDSLSVLDQLLGAAAQGQVGYSSAAALLGYTPDSLLDEIVDAFAAGDGKGVFASIDKVIEVGQDPRRFGEDLLERMRDLVIVAQVPEAVESGLIDVATDQADRLRGQAAALGPGELTRAAEVIATGLTQMRGTTAPRLHLELICARVLLPVADQDGRGLHARLDRLERRLDMPSLVPTSGQPAPGTEPTCNTERPVRPVPPGDEQPTVERPTSSRPVPERPSQRPPAKRPNQRPPAASRPTETAPAAQAAPMAAAGGPSTADLRRLWPQVLDEVKSRKRFTHALLSQNAHIVEVRGKELLLGFTSQGTLERFRGGGSIDVLRDCLVAVVGADLQIQASVDGGPSQASRQPSQHPAQPAPRPTRQPDPQPAEPAPPPDDEWAGDDDEVLDETGTDAAELLVSQLGAQIIDEQDA